MLNNEYLFDLDTGAALVKLIKNFQFFTQTMK